MKLRAVLAAKGPKVHTISPVASVRQAVSAMAAANIGAVVVTSEAEGVIGILSERDILRDLDRNAAVLDQPVSRLMSTDVVVGSLDDDASAVLQRMTAGHFRHLPVVDAGVLVGLVTTADIVIAQLHNLQGTVETLETRLMEETEESEDEPTT